MRYRLRLLALGACLLIPATTHAKTAKEAWELLVESRFHERPEFAFIKNDPSLPNILIYGDSISIAYTQRVRQKLKGKANVYRLYCNGGDSGSFISKMEAMHNAMRDKELADPWDFDWDVIQFNVGLHDLKYSFNGKLDSVNGKQVSSIPVYQANLRDIMAYLQALAPKAKLIFATTTPVPKGGAGRIAGDAARYNQAALQVFKAFPAVAINDLFSFSKPQQEQWWTRPGNVHYNEEGRNAQGDEVARVIRDQLNAREGRSNNHTTSSLSPDESNIILADDSPQARFAASEIRKALDQGTSRQIVLGLISDQQVLAKMAQAGLQPKADLKAEGFVIETVGSTIYVLGGDAAGLMYGGLELAEVISTRGIESVETQVQNPYMKMRGTKFNIPLDVRTPSYSDVCDAAQKNIPEMWSFDFWREYIDTLAKYRYNYVSLWSMHPFPSLVKLPDYPNIALDDVHRSTVAWKEHYSSNGHGFDAPEIVNNYEVIKKISIEDKIKFWRRVMRYGKERNVDFYFVTWNIFDYGTRGQYGITDRIDNPITRDYFRQSVKQMFLTYPDLAGIGLTTGENMYGHSTEEKEDWAFATYAQGVLDAIKLQPGRKITFIHRQHQTGALKVAEKFKPLIEHEDINFIFSFKYAKAHVYSSIHQVYHQGFVRDIQQERDLKTIWTLRNDDIFHFRWGAPDFVRAFIKNIPYDVSEGYYYGSDQYVWGREFLSRYPHSPRQIEIVKHQYQWQLWGRLGYNPDLGNDRFRAILQSQYPEVDASQLFEAWQRASMIYPLTTGFHWGALDFQWYIESGQSRPDPAQTPTGYHDVNRFISLSPHKGTGYVSIPAYVDSLRKGKKSKGTSPLAVAEKIEDHANQALDWALKVKASDRELRAVVDDIVTMSYLGLYYAHKITAATNLALFRADLQRHHYDKTIDHLNQSAGFWRRYASHALANNHNPLWTNRVGHVDWRKTYRHVLYDISANGGQLAVPCMVATPGGTILEAEDAEYKTTAFQSSMKNYTGRGYLRSPHGDAKQSVTWQFDAPESGDYILEFRYSLRRQNNYDSPVVVNGAPVENITFWMTGKPEFWVWDRVTVRLKKGKNRIQISPEGFVLLDHLNILKK